MNKKDMGSNSKSRKNVSNDTELSKKIEMENNKKAMTGRVKEEIGSMEELEDTTKYGEFVSSYFAWLTLEGQKRRAEHLEEMTNKDKN